MNTTSARSVHVDETLDCTGLLCPMPIIKTQQAIKKLASGQVLEMIATDPGSIPDTQAWARQTGNELLEYRTDGDCFRFLLRKGI